MTAVNQSINGDILVLLELKSDESRESDGAMGKQNGI